VTGADHYIPILKAKLGELTALGHVDVSLRSSMTPLVEALGNPADTEDTARLQTDLETMANRLQAGWGVPGRIIVDCGLVGEDLMLASGELPLEYLAARLRAHQIESSPVVRISSSTAVLTAAGKVAATDGLGVCIRLEREDIDDVAGVNPALANTLVGLGMQPADIDLVVDFANLDGSMVGPFGALATVILTNLVHLQDWRSVTLASGAFPQNLSGFTNYVPGTVQRADALLWRAVQPRTTGSRTPSYGDYAVTHPLLADTGPYRPPPQLRYVDIDDWHVLRGPRDDPKGNRVIFDLAAQFVAPNPGHFRGATASWGDSEIARWATSQGGPGSGSQWRAVATSVHLAFVANRIATVGAP
jgi:hypothetical protein